MSTSIALRGQTTVSWTNTSGGSWASATNWSPSNVPNTLSYSASIAAAGTYTVTMPSSEVINSLQVNSANATLVLDANLYLAGNSSSMAAGTVQLSSADIVAEPSTGSLALTNAGTLTSIGGTNYIYGIYSSPNGVSFTNTGTVGVSVGTLVLGYSSGDIITNAATGLMKADGGSLSIGYNQATWSNAGTIEAINGGTVTLGNGSWVSTGIFTANSGGTINFDGAITTSQLNSQTINGSGGTLNIGGTLTNTGATLAPPASGFFTLAGGTIIGGTVDNSTAETLTFSGGGSTLNGVSMLGPFSVPSNASFWVSNGTSFANGTTTFGNNYVYLQGPSAVALTVASTATWTGNLSIYAEASNVGMVNNGTITNTSGNNYFYGTGHSGFSFTNSGTVSVSGGSLTVGYGAGDTVTNQSGGTFSVTNGTLNLGYTAGSVANAGLLEASGSSSTLTLGSGTTTWTSTGSILATNGGTVNLGGSFTTAQLQAGTIDSNGGGTVVITGTLDNTDTTLSMPHSGVYTLSGGTILGGIVSSGSLTFGSTAGTLDGTAMDGNFNVPSYGRFNAQDNTTFAGGTTTFASNSYTLGIGSSGTALTIAPSATWTGSYSIYAAGGGSVSNQGTMIFSSGYNYLYGTGSAGSAFHLNNSGTITATGGSTYLGYYSGDSVTNTGTITANGGTINLGSTSGATWSSSGALSALNGGTLNLGGSFTTAALGGTVDMSGGGVVAITGTLTNTSTTLVAPHTGAYTLSGGTILGGTVASGALTFNSSIGTLDGVTMNGDFSVPSYARFNAQDNTTFTGGTTTFSPNSYTLNLGSSGTALTLSNTETWTGSISIDAPSGGTMVNQGTMIFSSGYNYLYGDDSVATGFKLSNSGSISSTGGIVYLGYYTGDSVTNSGTITANGGTVSLGYANGSSSWHSTGALVALNSGTINLGGTFTNADLGGTVDMSGGGVVAITGTLQNAGATLAPPHSGVFTLSEGTILGGTVASGALTFNSSDGTLDGVTMQGNFSVPNYATFDAQNNTTFAGGTTTFGASSSTIYLTGSGTALTIAPDATWTGHFTVYGDDPSISMVNQGTMTASSGYNYFSSYDPGFTLRNSGTISSTGGELYLGDSSYVTFINTGSVIADGGTINLGSGTSGFWSTTGSLLAKNNGVINLAGTFTTADLGGTVDMNTGGTVNITGTLTNTGATLAAPNSGVFTLGGGTILNGSVASGALTFSGSAGVLDGVTMNGAFSVPAYTYFTLKDNTTFAGGTTTFSPNAYTLYVNGSGTALTVAPSATFTGRVGVLSESANPVTIALEGILAETSGTDYLYGYSSSGLTILNSGTISASNSAQAYLGYGASDSFTNESGGVVEANGGTIFLGAEGAGVSNLSGGTLSGGTWEALGGGIISFESSSSPVATNSATIILSGAGSTLRTYTGSYSYQTLEQTLTANTGTLEVLGNRGFAASNDLMNTGTLVVGGGTFSEHSITTGSGSVIAGTGTVSTSTGGITVGTGSSLSPGIATAGSYVGTLSFGSGTPLTLASGGAMTIDLKNAASATAGTDYDTISVAGSVSVTATPGSPFTIYVESINPSSGSPGSASINLGQSYQWTLLSAGSISGFNASDFTIDSSLFSNGVGGGSFSLSDSGTAIMLNFSPVPEPSTWALMGAGLAASLVAIIRRTPRRRIDPRRA